MSKIKVENIVKTFNKHSRNANKVLKGVSFELPEKGLVCIFGKSGSGKTTLLNIIGGLEKTDGGKVFIDGEETRGKTDKIRNAKIGFIFQNYYLEKGYRVSEILRNQMIIAGFKDEKEIARRTEAALQLVDMERFKNKQGDALSGGQQQRVAIARAIVKGSDIILADEPTGNLDAENTMKVMDILKEISKTQLVVIVTHEVSLIKKYADSHIKIVDGELVKGGEIEETELAPDTYDNVENERERHDEILKTFTKSTEKRNGRLFNLKNIFKHGAGDSEKAYSTGNIFKQIFILALAVVVCFFAFNVFEAMNTVTETKTLEENTVYTNLNTYRDIREVDSTLYDNIDFFDADYSVGTFSYTDITALSDMKLEYVPCTIETNKKIVPSYGRIPQTGEVMISRRLAEEIKKQLRLEALNTDRTMLMLMFENNYKVSGIVESEEKFVYFNKIDYVNFLGVYKYIQISDASEIFLQKNYSLNSFTAEICLADEIFDLRNNQVIVEISRNSLYKMMSDTIQADSLITQANSQLAYRDTAMYVIDSKPMYVKKIQMTRAVMSTDIKLYVNSDVLNNIFVYLKPNMTVLSANKNQSNGFYFSIKTNDLNQLDLLSEELSIRGIKTVDLNQIYERRTAEEKADATNGLYIFVLVIALLLIIYFFIEKSASIKSSKEYGVYRAIGVNRSNLLFKEIVSTVANNVISYFVFSALTTTLIAIRYAIMNVAFTGFIGLSAACFAVSALLMVGISLIPYLFVLTESPSEILARYDI